MLGPLLKGSIVTLAPVKPEHLDRFCDWFADPEVIRFLTYAMPYTLKEEQAWFERVSSSEKDVLWGLFVDGEIVGTTSISQIDWRSRHAMTGIVIGNRTWWGRGVASEAMRLRTCYAFEELGLEKLVTRVMEGNTASRRALEKAGFQTVGVHRRHEYRNGHRWDAWVGEVLRDDWQRSSPTSHSTQLPPSSIS